jgi:hypothetical protein
LFQTGKVEGKPMDLHLYVHQMQAIAKAQNRQSYVVTTGTGSGKSLAIADAFQNVVIGTRIAKWSC